MNRIFISGGWYGVALPSGHYVVCCPMKWKIETHQGSLDPEQGFPIHLDATDVGGFRFAGKAWEGRHTIIHRDGAWGRIEQEAAGGQNSVAFGPDGQLHINGSTTVYKGANGIRYVDESGALVTGDATYASALYRLHEYTRRGDVVIGQSGWDTVAVVLDALGQPTGERRALVMGRGPRGSTDIKVKRSGDAFGVSVHQFDNGGTELLWFDRSELAQFPLEIVPEEPKPVPSPPPEPKPLPKPEEPPVSQLLPEAVWAIVQEEFAKYPDNLWGGACKVEGDPRCPLGAILNRICWRANGNKADGPWGLSRKVAGYFVDSPVGPVASDILQHKGQGEHGLYDVLTSEWKTHRGEPIEWHGDPSGRPWVAPAKPEGNGTQPTPEPQPQPQPQPPPSPDLEPIRAQIAELQREQEMILQKIAALEERGALSMEAILAAVMTQLRVTGRTHTAGGLLSHSHQADLELERK